MGIGACMVVGGGPSLATPILTTKPGALVLPQKAPSASARRHAGRRQTVSLAASVATPTSTVAVPGTAHNSGAGTRVMIIGK